MDDSADPSPTELHTGCGALFDDGFDDNVEHAPPAEAEYDSDRLSDDSDWDPVEISDGQSSARLKSRGHGSA